MNRLIVPLLILLYSATACAHDITAPPEQVSVVGVGEVEAEPDQAVLRISIKALAKDLATAKQQADKRYASVLEVLTQAGIPDQQVKLQRLSMQPKYKWSDNKQQYQGEEVVRSLSITINDLDKVPSLMQSLVENGLSTMEGLSSGFQDRAALLKQALGAAASDARSKAEFLAEQFARKLGPAMQISEHNNAPTQQRQEVQMMARNSMAADSAPQEMFGTQIIRASVNASFQLR